VSAAHAILDARQLHGRDLAFMFARISSACRCVAGLAGVR